MYAATKLPPYAGQDKFLHSFLLIDTLTADAVTRHLTGNPASSSGALFRIALGKDSVTVVPVETIIGGDPASGTTSTLTLYRPNKERTVRGTFASTSQKYRLSLEGTVLITW